MHLEESITTLVATPAVNEAPSSPSGVFTRRNLIIAALLAVGACIFFYLFARLCGVAIHPKHGSPYNYFAAQADAWLHGRWDIVTHFKLDQVMIHGKYYSIYGPFPALLMLPLVVVLGPNASDTLFTMVLSGINLGLLFLLFEQLRATGLSRRGWRENLLWSILLYLGSTALFLSINAAVYFTGHIVACSCLLVSLLLAFRRHYTWSAVALGCAFFSRPTLLLGFPLLVYLAWQDGGEAHPVALVAPFARSVWARRPDWHAVPWRRLGGVAAVVGACLALYLLRDWAMFGNPLENGYNLQLAQLYPFVLHGVNSPYHIAANILDDFFSFPQLSYPTPYSSAPTINFVTGATGMSVFLTTPLFLLLFSRNKRRSWLRVALWGTILLFLAFVLTFYTAGYPQFGTRYLFDIYPVAWVLLAASEIRTDWRFVALGIFALLINILGSFQFWAHTGPYSLPAFLVG